METRQNTRWDRSANDAYRTGRGGQHAEGAAGAVDALATASHQRIRELLGWRLIPGNPWSDACGAGR